MNSHFFLLKISLHKPNVANVLVFYYTVYASNVKLILKLFYFFFVFWLGFGCFDSPFW